MSNEEIKRAILEMDEREELAKDMLEQVSPLLDSSIKKNTIFLISSFHAYVMN